MTITITTNYALKRVIENCLIKLHDEFLIANSESILDWQFGDRTSEGLIKFEIIFENLSQDDVQYMLETLQILERGITNG